MLVRLVAVHVAVFVLAAGSWPASLAGQTPGSPAARSASAWDPPRTPWGDPDIQGLYTNKDENGTPMDRPQEFAGRSLDEFGDAEMAALRRQRQERAVAGAGRIGGAQTGAGPPHWYEHLDAENSQPWLVFQPASGRVPPQTAEARARAQARQAERRGRGPADSWVDRSLYDRCISLGVPGSMMPMIYGNAYDITQAPGYVAIRYEMIHEARVIPLDGRPALPSAIRHYMGDARGRWEGTTLVVETTNVLEQSAYRGASDTMRIVERFTPIGPDRLRWEVRFEDPRTWEEPWAFTMPLKRDADARVFEYACHEGNRGLANILSAARAEEAAAAGSPP